MPRGGKRAGAGRKKGSKVTRTRETAERIAGDGQLMPLQYVIDVMRNPKTKQRRRDWAAATALPYVHPRLQTIEGNPDKPIVHEHRLGTLDAARRIAFVLFTAAEPEIAGRVINMEQKKVPA